MSIVFEQRGGAVRFRVSARPRAARSELAGELDGALKVRLAALPSAGEANRELIRLLAKLLDVPPSNVRLVHGAGGRQKLVEVDGVSAATARRLLAGA